LGALSCLDAVLASEADSAMSELDLGLVGAYRVLSFKESWWRVLMSWRRWQRWHIKPLHRFVENQLELPDLLRLILLRILVIEHSVEFLQILVDLILLLLELLAEFFAAFSCSLVV